HGFQNGHRGQLIEFEIELKTRCASSNIGIGGEMEHHVESGIRKQRPNTATIENIELNEVERRHRVEMRDVTASAEPQIVRAPDLLSSFEEAVAKVAAAKAGSTRHSSSQRPRATWMPAILSTGRLRLE